MVTTSTLQNSNFLQATGFKIVIYRQRFANLEFFAQTVSHPSVSISPTQISYRKTDIFEPGDKLIYDDLQIDAIVDEDMHVYEEMLNWQNTLTSLGTLQLATNAGSVEPLILPITFKYNTFSFT